MAARPSTAGPTASAMSSSGASAGSRSAAASPPATTSSRSPSSPCSSGPWSAGTSKRCSQTQPRSGRRLGRGLRSPLPGGTARGHGPGQAGPGGDPPGSVPHPVHDPSRPLPDHGGGVQGVLPTDTLPVPRAAPGSRSPAPRHERHLERGRCVLPMERRKTSHGRGVGGLRRTEIRDRGMALGLSPRPLDPRFAGSIPTGRSDTHPGGGSPDRGRRLECAARSRIQRGRVAVVGRERRRHV